MSMCPSGCECSCCKEFFKLEAENQERNKQAKDSIFYKNRDRRVNSLCGASKVYKYGGDCKSVLAVCNRIKSHKGNHRAIASGDKVFWKS